MQRDADNFGPNPGHIGLREPIENVQAIETDVVVVGARCAGAATAMLLARAGHDVVVVDRALFPSDTLSTHALARGAVVQLGRWGLLDAVMATGAPALREIEFHVGGTVVQRTLKDRCGVDHLVAPRRHVLDPVVQAAAVDAGARLITGATVTDVVWSGGRAAGVRARTELGELEIRARHVVGADGLRSRVARSVGALVMERRESTGSAHYRYHRGNWPALEYHVGEAGMAGVFPTNDGEACIWVCTPDRLALEARRSTASLDETFERLLGVVAPGLSVRAEPATAASSALGMLSMPNQFRAPFGPGWSLVGDAGYHRDAITGHGIADAFRDAELLADSIGRVLVGDASELVAMSEYAKQREAMSREVFELTCELSKFRSAAATVDLQRQLGVAIDAHAELLAGRDVPVTTLAA